MMDNRIDLNVVMIAGPKLVAERFFEALSQRYRRVCIPYMQFDQRFDYLVSEDGVKSATGFRLPRLPRYLMLLYMWTRVYLFLLKYARKRKIDVLVSLGMQSVLMYPMLRLFSACRSYVYYAGDWFPNQKWPQCLDRLCVRLSEETWNVRPGVAEARRTLWPACPSGRSVNVDVLYGVVGPFRRKPVLDRPYCCYLGGVRDDIGLDLAVEALAELKRKGITLGLKVIGKVVSDRIVEDTKSRCRSSGVSGQVEFLGVIDDESLPSLLDDCICGLAIFTGGKNNYSNWTTPGKVKRYLEGGVPVILSKDNIMVQEVVSRQAGLAVNDSSEDLTDALSLFLKTPETVVEYSRNAYELAKEKTSPQGWYDAIEGLAGPTGEAGTG